MHQKRITINAYRQDELLHRDLDLDPLLIGQRWPDEVRLRDGVLVGVQDDLRLLVVDVQATEEQDQARERRIAGDGLEPIVVQTEQHHLGLRRPL